MLDPESIMYLVSCAGRVAEALERMAAADERRNELLELDQAERRETWLQQRRDTHEALERLAASQ